MSIVSVMSTLSTEDLQDSGKWVSLNAEQILYSVLHAGGWAAVFPKGVPSWLHKLRNYFNIEPKSLKLVNKSLTDHWMQDIRSHGELNSYVGERTLTGHVYHDEEIAVWYQMGPGGTIYHWGKDVKYPKPEAAWTHLNGQDDVPIFKLVSPDGTGGSKETIITNPKIRRYREEGKFAGVLPHIARGTKIGATDQQVLVIDRVVRKMKHQGSYNFAETAVVGLDEHNKYDVNTHKKDPIYLDPPDRFQPLSKRIFTEFVIHAAGGKESTTPSKHPER